MVYSGAKLLYGLQALGTMLIYPNSMSFPIMDGGGIPPAPQGFLTIKVLRGDKLGSPGIAKIDPFVEVSSAYAHLAHLLTVFCCSSSAVSSSLVCLRHVQDANEMSYLSDAKIAPM